jgi:hypothetical protein
MHRSDFQKLAAIRVLDAKALYAAGQFQGAYYIAGYAIECALKACLCRQFKLHDLPDRKLVLDAYTHDLVDLVRLAGLKQVLDVNIRAHSAFGANWAVVKDWSEQERYKSGRNQLEASDFISAVTARKQGVLAWLKQHW